MFNCQQKKRDFVINQKVCKAESYEQDDGGEDVDNDNNVVYISWHC
jgi:hypothetical protein